MLTLYLVQTIAPLVFIAWLAVAPPDSAAGFWTQSAATCAGLAALGIVGIWTFPPWWAPFVLGGLLVATIVRGLIGRRERPLWPRTRAGWLFLAGFAAFGLFAASEARAGLAERAIPATLILDLASPLGPGTYLVANGGAGLSLNAHAALLDPSIAGHRLYRGTAHGVDLVALNLWGFRADGIMPADPGRYEIFDRSVFAPCAGVVAASVDGLPDMPVPRADTDHLAGNHVILRCLGADILLGHFRRGSVRVAVGQSLAVGEAIARVGNSGNSSEPHLHINAQKPGTAEAPFSGAPVPIRIDGRYLLRNDRFFARGRGGQP